MARPTRIRPACEGLTELFFTPEEDGRNEVDRSGRENNCKVICFTCQLRLKCLLKAITYGEKSGVWGGMSEKELRLFRAHLRREGYDETLPPDELELRACLASFYSAQQHEKVMAKNT